MTIPLSYKRLTIKQFVEVKTIESACATREATVAALITHYTGKSIIDIDLSWLKIYRIRANMLLDSWETVKRAKIKEHIWIKGKRYKSVTDATKLNVNQYTTIKELSKNGQSDKNIHKLAALIFYRYKIGRAAKFNDEFFDEIANDMLSAKVGDIAPTVFFYARVLERLSPLLDYYLLRSQMEIEQAVRDLMYGQDLSKTTVGITP